MPLGSQVDAPVPLPIPKILQRGVRDKRLREESGLHPRHEPRLLCQASKSEPNLPRLHSPGAEDSGEEERYRFIISRSGAEARRSQALSEVRELQGGQLPIWSVFYLLLGPGSQGREPDPERERLLERTEEPVGSFYPRSGFMLARKMLGMVGDMHLKVREELLCGRYDWFKPIYGTNIEASMIKANKDLQEVIDNGHLVRGHASKKFMKEGKIFTFQGNEPLTYWTDEQECVHEDIDNKGRPYVEYIYNSADEMPKIEQWVKCSEDKFRTFTREDCDLYVNAPNLQIRSTFHLFFFGLDKVNLTIKELYQEILIKMQTLVGNVDIKNIMILDNESLLGRS